MGTSTRAGYADVLVGLQYGDEGKARVVDHLAGEYDVIARFNGGANAGHTVVTPHGTLRLRQIPSGVLHSQVSLYIGSGCVVGLHELAAEIGMLAERGIELADRLVISNRCPIVQPAHLLRDRMHGKHIGTTGNGIGPCYAGLAARMEGDVRSVVQACDLIRNEDLAFEHIETLAAASGHDEVAELLNGMREAWQVIRPFVSENPVALLERVEAGARVLFEGAQSVMLDVVHGEQPWVTSSHTVPSYAFVGGDLPAKYHRRTIGVAKAIVSRVGSGPFPAELGGQRSEAYCERAAQHGWGKADEASWYNQAELIASDDALSVGVALRMLCSEYGTGTGRPRRIGLLDIEQLRLAVLQFGVDELYLNKCDSLALFSQTHDRCIPIVIGSDNEAPLVKSFPAFDRQTLPPDNTFPLPPELDALVDWLSATIGRPLRGIGLGAERAQMRTIDAER